MSLSLPKCDFCKYLYQDKDDYCCEAFPKGIPLQAMNEDEDAECNNGIKFKEK